MRYTTPRRHCHAKPLPRPRRSLVGLALLALPLLALLALPLMQPLMDMALAYAQTMPPLMAICIPALIGVLAGWLLA